MTLYKGTIPIAGNSIDDSTLVHKAGAETITGNKTFTGSVSLGTNTTGVTQASGDNSTKIATTAWVKSYGGVCPPGTICAFGGSSAPSGWLICNGGAISRTTYADLFSVIGTTYGSGDGSTTFNLPNRPSTRNIYNRYWSNDVLITLYDDGWCDQEGVITGDTTTASVTFPISYAATPFFTTSGGGRTSSGNGGYSCFTSALSSTGASFWIQAGFVRWRASYQRSGTLPPTIQQIIKY